MLQDGIRNLDIFELQSKSRYSPKWYSVNKEINSKYLNFSQAS